MSYKIALKKSKFLNRYSKPFGEHWFVMIKPKTPHFVLDEIIKMINDYGMVIEEILTHNLNSSEASYGFNTKPKIYRDYLCSGLLRCIIVYGENAAKKCLIIKERIRLKHNVSYETHKNYIHVPEEGFEFKLQKNIFFQDYKTISYSDLNITWKPGILEEIYKLEGKVSWVGIITDLSSYIPFIHELLEMPKDCVPDIGLLSAIRLNQNNNSCVRFISPWLIDDVYTEMINNHKFEEINIDGEGTDILEINKQDTRTERVTIIDNCIAGHPYRGLKSMGPNVNLAEVEECMDICFNYSLFTWGGSESIDKIGEYISPEYIFYKFINSFKNV